VLSASLLAVLAALAAARCVRPRAETPRDAPPSSTLSGSARQVGPARSANVELAPRGSEAALSAQVSERGGRLPKLCATQGLGTRLAGLIAVREPSNRFLVPGSSGQDARVAFVYRGPAAVQRALASGAVREQLGLKLLAGDSCNVLYVMWRRAPKNELVVSVKRNPGQVRHSECGNSGYENLRAERSVVLAELAPDSRHELSARLQGGVLQVHLDGREVWFGSVAEPTRGLAGPAGFRSDNVELDLLDVQASPASSAALVPSNCREF
jgi:hypothetical protein